MAEPRLNHGSAFMWARRAADCALYIVHLTKVETDTASNHDLLLGQL